MLSWRVEKRGKLLNIFRNSDVEAIETPIGMLPKYDDLKKLFAAIDKEYPQSLYNMQFALYVDNIVSRIDLQSAEYAKEDNVPKQLFTLYAQQKEELLGLKEKYGNIVAIDNFS